MKGIESGKDKVKKICEVLRRETLEPAKREAEQTIEQAQLQAERLILDAKKEAERIHQDALKEIEKEKNVFQSSLNQACKQALESLKEEMEEKLFNQELSKLLTKPLQDSKVIVDLISAVTRALEKEGINSDLSVYVPSAVPARSINALLSQDIIQKLKEKSVLIGPMKGGIEVKIHKDNITIDVTEAALKELVANYIRKDFREILFGAK
jgi:V/A-type H+/Na+-transporting ATPase subunit E